MFGVSLVAPDWGLFRNQGGLAWSLVAANDQDLQDSGMGLVAIFSKGDEVKKAAASSGLWGLRLSFLAAQCCTVTVHTLPICSLKLPREFPLSRRPPKIDAWN